MWNKEADVVVVGFGGAGASAAIQAHDAGAKVVILEKNPEGGGNTQYSAGTIREYHDLEGIIQYIEGFSFGTVERETIKAFAEEAMKNPEWLKDLGADLVHMETIGSGHGFPCAPHVIWPHLPGAYGMGGRWQVKSETGSSGGGSVWGVLARNSEERKIEILYNTPSKQLIRDENNEIIGVVADGPDGEIRVKAKRAVILACGGFEFDPDMQANYLGYKYAGMDNSDTTGESVKYSGMGNPGNTGDGIRMAQEVGASLWHMAGVACTLGYRIPEIDAPVWHRMISCGYAYVDQTGKRFANETGIDLHAFNNYLTAIDHPKAAFFRSPSYMIFDEDTRRSGPIATVGSTILGRWTNYHTWSDDNSEEVEKGWITQADTVADLAGQIGIDPKSLQKTIADFNSCCVVGYDPEFDRLPDTLLPIIRPPYYAIAIYPTLINTQGGPKRNAMAQVLDSQKEPIRRLYSAGELGSIWGILYPGGGNVTECLAVGRIAGKNAAMEEPWEK